MNDLKRLVKPVKGGALLITIVIAIIVGILSSAVILVAYYNRLQHQRERILTRLDNNVKSGINILLSDSSFLYKSYERTIDLFNHQDDSVKIVSGNWGVYKIGLINSFYGREARDRIFLFGEILPDSLQSAIYLTDHERPLGVVGQTSISGNAYLPKAGVQITQIDQRVFKGESPVLGEILESGKSLPALEQTTLNYLKGLTEYRSLISSKSDELESSDTLSRSFKESTEIIYHRGKLMLQNRQVRGNFVIKSDSCIDIRSGCVLENIIMSAPVIRISSGFEGSVQIIATDSVVVEQDCHLRYPSSIVLLKQDSKHFQPVLSIENGSNVEGVIMCIANQDDETKIKVNLSEKSRFTGLLYVSGFLSLKGKVMGAVATDYFLYNVGSNIYQNYLVDAEVDRLSLPKSFVGPATFKDITKRMVVAWLK